MALRAAWLALVCTLVACGGDEFSAASSNASGAGGVEAGGQGGASGQGAGASGKAAGTAGQAGGASGQGAGGGASGQGGAGQGGAGQAGKGGAGQSGGGQSGGGGTGQGGVSGGTSGNAGQPGAGTSPGGAGVGGGGGGQGGAPGGQGGAGAPGGSGGCVEASGCPVPSSLCQVAVCEAGVCGVSNKDGATLPDEPHNCAKKICQGGVETSVEDLTDTPSAGECDEAMCPANKPKAAGTPCSGGKVCDGSGVCGECKPGVKRCSGGTPQQVQVCKDGGVWESETKCTSFCQEAACVDCLVDVHCPGEGECTGGVCNAGVCGKIAVKQGQVLSDPSQTDCVQTICLDGVAKQVPDDTEKPPSSGDPCTTSVCSGGSPLTKSIQCAGGQVCENGECVCEAGKYLVGGACRNFGGFYAEGTQCKGNEFTGDCSCPKGGYEFSMKMREEGGITTVDVVMCLPPSGGGAMGGVFLEGPDGCQQGNPLSNGSCSCAAGLNKSAPVPVTLNDLGSVYSLYLCVGAGSDLSKVYTFTGAPKGLSVPGCPGPGCISSQVFGDCAGCANGEKSNSVGVRVPLCTQIPPYTGVGGLGFCYK